LGPRLRKLITLIYLVYVSRRADLSINRAKVRKRGTTRLRSELRRGKRDYRTTDHGTTGSQGRDVVTDQCSQGFFVGRGRDKGRDRVVTNRWRGGNGDLNRRRIISPKSRVHSPKSFVKSTLLRRKRFGGLTADDEYSKDRGRCLQFFSYHGCIIGWNRRACQRASDPRESSARKSATTNNSG
jgi:hypothetical protein